MCSRARDRGERKGRRRAGGRWCARTAACPGATLPSSLASRALRPGPGAPSEACKTYGSARDASAVSTNPRRGTSAASRAPAASAALSSCVQTAQHEHTTCRERACRGGDSRPWLYRRHHAMHTCKSSPSYGHTRHGAPGHPGRPAQEARSLLQLRCHRRLHSGSVCQARPRSAQSAQEPAHHVPERNGDDTAWGRVSPRPVFCRAGGAIWPTSTGEPGRTLEQ